MKKEIAELLVTALRSGEYEQAVGKLRNESGYCCLGVLCDIYSKQDGVTDEWDFYEVNGVRTYRLLGADAILPPSVWEWAGMRSSNGSFSSSGGLDSSLDNALSQMNDNGSTFSEIAEFIEENYERL